MRPAGDHTPTTTLSSLTSSPSMSGLHTLPREVVQSALDMPHWPNLLTRWVRPQMSNWTDDDLPITTESFIGIVVAISGNVLISLALNCQKLAHQRLIRERERLKQRHRVESISSSRTRPAPDADANGHNVYFDRNGNTSNIDSYDEAATVRALGASAVDDDVFQSYGAAESTELLARNDTISSRSTSRGRLEGLLFESEPLLPERRRSRSSSTQRVTFTENRPGLKKANTGFLSRMFRRGHKEELLPQNGSVPATPRTRPEVIKPILKNANTSVPYKQNASLKFEDHQESDYLKSKLWWFGFLLMNIGELGNFISYGFAPASIVAPLGTFALIANCFFAPLMLKERFRKKDIIGIALAILGAVTVVLSADPSDVRLSPDGLIQAITRRPFIILSIVYATGAIALVSLSSQRIGQRWVYIDVGVCALFGGFTVLSTKAISTLLTMEWYEIFKEWITYPVLAVLLGTGIGQIRYLNRALMKFDSKVVIPTQFVLFNLSAIVGSAVLYGDFRKATLHQMVTFVYGCGTTFAGVYLLTRGSGGGKGDEDGDDESMRGEHVTSIPIATPTRTRGGVGGSGSGGVGFLLRRKTSHVSLVGLSPAQRVLLVRSPSPNPSECGDEDANGDDAV